MDRDVDSARSFATLPEEETSLEEACIELIVGETIPARKPGHYKLKCQACHVRIGPTYDETQVHYDTLRSRWVCGGCATWDLAEADRYVRIATRHEVEELPIGDLRRLLLDRSRQLKETV
jgi:hypothetical protein